MSGVSDSGKSPGVVVVGVDGSLEAHDALAWAVDYAHATGSALKVVHVQFLPGLNSSHAPEPVWPYPQISEGPQLNEEDRKQAAKLFAELVADVVPVSYSLSIETEVRRGDYAQELLAAAADAAAELLVLGKRGLGGFSSLLMGSVSDQVAAHARCPVVVIAKERGDGSGPVVVGVDGSETSDRALEWAADTALAFGSPLMILGVWDATLFTAGSMYSPMAIVEGVKVFAAGAKANVAQAEKIVSARHPKLDVAGEVVEGHVGSILTHRAAELSAKLLVVGSRGRGGFASLLLGSASHQSLHHAKTPVAVIPAFH